MMRFRQIHLDFHTSEKITGIGERFDPKQFQEMLKLGHVDSITVFSKCHHGWAYHPSKANQIHPHLKFDLLKAQIDAAHEIGVRTPVYISAGLDEKIARVHPEWLKRNKDERLGWNGDFMNAGYHEFCLNTPYLDVLLAQIAEVTENYDCDGIFLDIVGVRTCWCQYCMRELLEQGKDPRDDAAVRQLGEKIYKNYTDKVEETIHSRKPGLPIFHNSGHVTKGRRDLAYVNTHLELESLPTGGWGYDHFPASARYVETLKPKLEYLGMTGKFHTSWGEFGGYKHPNALKYEAALSLAFGAKCSVGDQLHPNGFMDRRTYSLIGAAYKEVEEKEAWCEDTGNIADIAILSQEANRSAIHNPWGDKTNGDVGASRIMLEGKYLYDIIDMDADLEDYKLLILPDSIILDDKTAAKINNYLEKGGKLLASGKSGLDKDGKKFLIDFGCEFAGESEYSPTYEQGAVYLTDGEAENYSADFNEYVKIPSSPAVIYGKAYKVNLAPDRNHTVSNRINPYFNRDMLHFSSHQHTPYDWESKEPGVIMNGNVTYCSWEIFTEYATKGSITTKEFIIKMIDGLLPCNERTAVTPTLGAQGILTLRRQEKHNRSIIHLLYASPVKRGNGIEVIEDLPPIYDTAAEVKADEPKRVYLAPQNQDIGFTYENGRVKFSVDKFICHQMVIIE